MGYKNLIKWCCHVSDLGLRRACHSEEIAPLDNKAASVARCQGRSYCWERVSKRGLALTWLKGWWLPPHLMRSTKSPGCIYVEKISKQCCFGCRNSEGVWECVWWDKHSSGGLDDQQMEGQDRLKGDIYNVRDPPRSETEKSVK